MRKLKVTDYFRRDKGNPYYNLDLSGLGLGNAELKSLICQMTAEQKLQVRKLDLSYNQVTDISALSCLVGLKWLVFSNNQISDLKPIEGLVGLIWLFFPNNSVTDISALESLTALEWVYVRGNPITDYSVLYNLPDCIVHR
jgi:Leucine-rich repeat (LRR) protein